VTEIVESGQYHELLDLLEGIADGPDDLETQLDYWRRVAAQSAFTRVVLTVFADDELDALLCPDVQVLPPTESDIRSGKYGTLTFPTNTLIASQSGCPAVSVPTGLTDEGLPIGMELIGKPMDERTLLRLAYAFEQRVSSRENPPTTPAIDEPA
jgi:Asp-tRNA(Asn)/Glu-tRNA(Gln) amidotransferase A subunit family amidase